MRDGCVELSRFAVLLMFVNNFFFLEKENGRIVSLLRCLLNEVECEWFAGSDGKKGQIQLPLLR